MPTAYSLPLLNKGATAREYACSLRRSEPSSDLAADAHHFRHLQRRIGRQAIVERHAFEQRHGDQRHTVLLVDLVDRHHVIVLERRCRTCFAQESLTSARATRDLGQHHLERHLTLQSRVFRQKNCVHAAAAQLLQDPIRAESTQFVGRLRRIEGKWFRGLRGQRF